MCQERQKLLATISHSCCDTLPAEWCSCGAHASRNHVCRENAHLQTNQHLNAIVLPVQRATKYQENPLYIILAVKSNLQCSWHQGQSSDNAQIIPLSGRLQSLGGKFTLINCGSQKAHIKWKRQKYLPLKKKKKTLQKTNLANTRATTLICFESVKNSKCKGTCLYKNQSCNQVAISSAQAYCRLFSVISFNTQLIHTDHHQIQEAVNFP